MTVEDERRLFPGSLAACYDAFVAAVEAEGQAVPEFKKTQVSYGLERKFAWLIPLTKSKCLLVLDMYDRHPDPTVRNIIRADKYTHQIEIQDPATIIAVSAMGLFRLAYEWGARSR